MVTVRKTPLLFLFALLLVSGYALRPLAAQDHDAPAAEPEERALKEPLKAFQPYIGAWEINGQWANGTPIWARNEYRVGMNGNFVEATTWAKNENGHVYQRYLTVWRYNAAEDKVQSHGFVYDGSYQQIDTSVETPDDGSNPVIGSEWQSEEGGPWFRQHVQMDEDTSYSWRVWTSPDGKEWEQIMDGQWKRVSKPPSGP